MRALALTTVAAASLLLAGCETTNMKMGSQEAKTVATGSAAGSTSANANSALERCASPLGTVSLVEHQQAGWYCATNTSCRRRPTCCACWCSSPTASSSSSAAPPA